MWDGHKVRIIEKTSDTIDGQSKTEFWVDPERNFAIVRRRFLRRSGPAAEWSVTNTTDCFGHEKVEPQVWLPKMVRKRSYLIAADDDTEPRLVRRRDLLCTQWKVNEQIAAEELRLKLPAGTKVRGRLEEFQAGLRRSVNFFVEPITTPLQRKLLNTNAVAYAEIDVTAFVDVNTEQVTPAKFDFGLLHANLKQLSDGKQEDPELYLMFDFGMSGRDRYFSNFVRGGVKEICQSAGYKSIRMSNRMHNANRRWRSVDSRLPSLADESNLGNQLVEVFPIRTRLSKFLARDADYYIDIKNALLLDEKQILDDQTKHLIESAIVNENTVGTRVHVRYVVGSTRQRAEGIEDSALIQKHSDPQLKAVEFLRACGFEVVRLIAVNGPSNYESTYDPQTE